MERIHQGLDRLAAVCCTVREGHKSPKRGVTNVVNIQDSQGSRGGLEGIYRSSLDARKPQNPTNSEEYQGHLQGVLYIV